MKRSPTQLIDRYARRMIVEYVIRDAIDFFHVDALSSAVSMRINVDLQMTVMVSVLYRLLGERIGQYLEKAEARSLYRNLVWHSGKITITEQEIRVQLCALAKTSLLVYADTLSYARKSLG